MLPQKFCQQRSHKENLIHFSRTDANGHTYIPPFFGIFSTRDEVKID